MRLSSAVAEAAAALGEATAATAWAQGRTMSDEDAVAFARALLADVRRTGRDARVG